MVEKIGEFSLEVIEVLNLDIVAGTAIYIGETNIKHMKEQHQSDFERYFNRLPRILSKPDYVGINPSDNSIEFIKEFGRYVKLAVRIAGDGEYYARSLYIINSKRVANFIKDGKLFAIDKKENL
jgi:hypothetical protein